MRHKELTAALDCLTRVLADPRVELTYRENLLKGRRELEKIRRSGKLDRNRVFLAVKLISESLYQEVKASSFTNSPVITRGNAIGE